MSREEEKREDRLQFREVRDAAGRLLFRISHVGVIEVKPKGGPKVLVNIYEYLEREER